jgi:outer membrane receptor protein involved in Fe transport
LKPAQAPRAGLVWSISNSLSLKALWSNAYRAPSLNELNLKAPNLVGNKDLKPENVETYDLALSYNGHDFYSSANVFYSKLTDIIQEEAVAIAAFGSPVTGMYQNAGNIQIMGAGMEIKGYVTKALLVSGSVNYQESFNDDGQWDLLPVPLYTGKLGVSYVSTAGWDMGVANVFMGDYSSLFTTGKVNPAPQGSIQTDLNAKLSLARWLKLQGKQDLALRAQVKNLFDVVTTIPEWGGPSKDALPDLRGRVFYLGMDMRI